MTRVYAFLMAVGLAASTALPAFGQQASDAAVPPAFELGSRSDHGIVGVAWVGAVPRAAGGIWYMLQFDATAMTTAETFEAALVCQVGTMGITGPRLRMSVAPGQRGYLPYIAQELPGEPTACYSSPMNDRHPIDAAAPDANSLVTLEADQAESHLVVHATNNDAVDHDVAVRMVAWNDQKQYAAGTGVATFLKAGETRSVDLSVDGDMSTTFTRAQADVVRLAPAGGFDRLAGLATRLEKQGALLLTNEDGTAMVAAAYTNPTDTERNLEVAGLFAGPPAELTPRVRIGEAMPHQRRVLRLPLDETLQGLGKLTLAEHAWTSPPTTPRAAETGQMALGKPVLFKGADGTPWVDVTVSSGDVDGLYVTVQANYWRGANLRATGMGVTPTMRRGEQVTARFPLRGLTIDATDTPDVVIESVCTCAAPAAGQ